MQVIVSVKRMTEYSSIVEMSEEDFKKLSADLESHDRAVLKEAEKKANKLIDTNDWQDDEFHSVEEFKAFVPD